MRCVLEGDGGELPQRRARHERPRARHMRSILRRPQDLGGLADRSFDDQVDHYKEVEEEGRRDYER